MDDDQEKRYCETLEVGGREEEKGNVKEKAAAAADGGSMMKLKFQSSGELSGGENVREPRICSVCNREFSSGKALGGHMRVHIQASKKEDELLNKLKTGKVRKLSANGSSPATNNASDTTCSLCGKNFPSRKSLFGHMRCHPEREWRGIQPPPPPIVRNSSSSTLSELLPRIVDDQLEFDSATAMDATVTKRVTDLQQSLSGSGWTVTDRRGRKIFHPDSDEEKDDDADAAYNLLLLGHGDLLFQQEERVKEECESNSPANKPEIEEKNKQLESTAGSKKKREIEASLADRIKNPPLKKLRIEERGSTEKKMDSCRKGKGKETIETGVFIDQCGHVISGMWAEAAAAAPAAAEDESDSKNTSGGPVGGVGDSNSNSNQEINSMKGKKKKRRKMKLIDLEEAGGGAGAGAGTGTVGDIAVQVNQILTTPDRYRCSTCNKSFPTHQALGGHRSSHNKFKNSQTIEDSACVDPLPPPLPPPLPVAVVVDYHDHYGFTPNANFTTHVHEAQVCNDGDGRAATAATTTTIAASSASMLSTTHQCKCCNKTFPSGQALGGHMRCHWNGPSEAPSSQVTSPGEASQTGPKLVLGFDLNELPAMEEEEEEEEEEEGTESVTLAAAGEASSSHNSVN